MSETDSEFVLFAKAVSRVLGWTYFLCWSLSFYPQPILNWRRKSTQGLAIDFPTCNVLGFIAYTISTASFLYSSTIREQYALRHPVAPEPTVRFNDFLFAAHGALLCIVIYSQFYTWIWGFKVGARQKASRVVLGIFWGSILGVLVVTSIVLTRGKDGGYDGSGWAWLDVIYALGYVKLIVTVIKYIPQVFVNYKRKSTVGWAISTILLDFSGGVLSLVKLGLSNISLAFDIIFMCQHYVLYTSSEHADEEEWPNERQGLLAPRIY